LCSNGPQLFDNAAFKPFLDRVPHIRDMANDFYQGKYGSCLHRLAQFEVRLACIGLFCLP
jgi:hypothetical protein